MIYCTSFKRFLSLTLLVATLFCTPASHAQEDWKKTSSPQLSPAQQPLLSYGVVKHSMKFLSFLFHYVTPLYEFTPLELQKDVFPIILFTEGLVYKADGEIEQGQKTSDLYEGVQPWLVQKENLMEVLKEARLYSPSIEIEANNLTEYWNLENDLMSGKVITSEKLSKAIQLRASDVMMIHHIFQNIKGISFGEKEWKAIQVIEAIRDLEDDIRSYEKDIETDDFNIYRMFVKFYGQEGQQRLQDELDQLWKDYYEIVDSLPTQMREKFTKLTTLYHEQRPRVSVPSAKIETL